LALTLEEYLNSADFEQQRKQLNTKLSEPVNTTSNNYLIEKTEKQEPLLDIFNSVQGQVNQYQHDFMPFTSAAVWDGDDEFSKLAAGNDKTNKEIEFRMQQTNQILTNPVQSPSNPFFNPFDAGNQQSSPQQFNPSTATSPQFNTSNNNQFLGQNAVGFIGFQQPQFDLKVQHTGPFDNFIQMQKTGQSNQNSFNPFGTPFQFQNTGNTGNSFANSFAVKQQVTGSGFNQFGTQSGQSNADQFGIQPQGTGQSNVNQFRSVQSNANQFGIQPQITDQSNGGFNQFTAQSSGNQFGIQPQITGQSNGGFNQFTAQSSGNQFGIQPQITGQSNGGFNQFTAQSSGNQFGIQPKITGQSNGGFTQSPGQANAGFNQMNTQHQTQQPGFSPQLNQFASHTAQNFQFTQTQQKNQFQGMQSIKEDPLKSIDPFANMKHAQVPKNPFRTSPNYSLSPSPPKSPAGFNMTGNDQPRTDQVFNPFEHNDPFGGFQSQAGIPGMTGTIQSQGMQGMGMSQGMSVQQEGVGMQQGLFQQEMQQKVQQPVQQNGSN
jgi:hypothetical protein